MFSLLLLCLRRTSQEVGNPEDECREGILGRVKSKAPNSVPLGRLKPKMVRALIRASYWAMTLDENQLVDDSMYKTKGIEEDI